MGLIDIYKISRPFICLSFFQIGYVVNWPGQSSRVKPYESLYLQPYTRERWFQLADPLTPSIHPTISKHDSQNLPHYPLPNIHAFRRTNLA